MKYPGVVLKKLRELNHYSIKEAAHKINRSVGWLSHVENQSSKCRLDQEEYERIFEIYGGHKHQKLIHTWISNINAEKARSADISYDGAILKYLREKSEKTLQEASQAISCSKGYLAKVENGILPIKIEKRNHLIKLYGYSPESFKNFYSREKRGLNVPARFKLNILIRHCDEETILAIFEYACSLKIKEPKL